LKAIFYRSLNCATAYCPGELTGECLSLLYEGDEPSGHTTATSAHNCYGKRVLLAAAAFLGASSVYEG